MNQMTFGGGRGVVREAAMSATAGLVASFPSPSFRHLWACPPPPKNGKRKAQGLAEVLRAVAGELRYSSILLLLLVLTFAHHTVV